MRTVPPRVSVTLPAPETAPPEPRRAVLPEQCAETPSERVRPATHHQTLVDRGLRRLYTSVEMSPRPNPLLVEKRVEAHHAKGEWPHPNLSTALERRVRSTPDAELIVAEDLRMTVGDLAASAERLAASLRRIGVGAGDVVSWQLPNWAEGAVLTFALDRLGAISNPILPIYREQEVSFIARQARSRVLVVPGVVRGFDHRELARHVRSKATDLEHVLVARADPLPGQASLDALARAGTSSSLPASPLGSHDVSALFYTSGTTSAPKGVMHTPSTLGAFVSTQAEAMGPGGQGVGILWFPLTHIGGVCAFVMGPVIHGTRAVFLDGFDPERGLELIEREQVTSAGGPTPILQAILATPGFSPARVRSVRVAGLGATDVPPELVREVGARLGAFVYRSYGMTECPMATAGRRGDPEEKLVTTDGRPTAGVALRIVDDSGRPVAAGTEGEVELFGPQLCVGYLDEALSRDAFTPDGFLRSGDLAVADADGFVRITGRKKDIIIRKGENLSSKAIEDELYEHPRIADATVIGLADRTSGERVCACVVLRRGVEALSLAELREFMHARGVMPQKMPEQLEVVDELPRNATGKVKKHELRARFSRTQS
jgi:non-ribosomal peptide synthetase component E (peptide arylation enzyme)